MLHQVDIPKTPFSLREPILHSWDELFEESDFRQTVSLQFHGIPLAFHFQSQDLASHFLQSFPRQWIEDKEFEAPIHIWWRGPGLKLKRFWDRDIENPDCFFKNDFVAQRDFIARRVSTGSFQLLATELIDDGLFNFLRYLIPLELLRNQQILFHSSCVLDETTNEAYLFFGPSGAGKTTIASLSEPGIVLGDDMNILSIKSRQVFVEGAALGQRLFAGDKLGQRFPVQKAFWLKQAEQTLAIRVDQGSMSYFLSSFANLFWQQLDQKRYLQVFQRVNQLSQNLSLYQLEFPKQKGVWDYVRSL